MVGEIMATNIVKNLEELKTRLSINSDYNFPLYREILLANINNKTVEEINKEIFQGKMTDIQIKNTSDLFKRINEIYKKLDELRAVDGKAFREYINSVVGLDTNFENKYADAVAKNIRVDISKNLSEIVNNLSDEYGQNKSIYKRGLNSIQNHSRLLDFQNEELNNQINDLKRLEKQISFSDRLIRINDDYYDLNSKRIDVLKQAFIPLLIILIIFILGMTGFIKKNNVFYYIFIIIIIYVIYAIYKFNSLDIQKQLSPELDKVRLAFEKIGSNIEEGAKELGKDLAQYIDENCNCEEDESVEDKKEEINKEMNINNDDTEIRNNKILTYYDGTAPAIRLL
jgi:hypothetical protein